MTGREPPGAALPPFLRFAAEVRAMGRRVARPRERVETLVRTLVDHFQDFGGIPLLAC
jgi:hypothetical protein